MESLFIRPFLELEMRCKRNKKNGDLNQNVEILHHLLYTKKVLVKCYVYGESISVVGLELEIERQNCT